MSMIQYDNAKALLLRYVPSGPIPTSLKVIFLAFLALNFQTFPGRWHMGVIYPWLRWMLAARLGRPTPPVSKLHPDPKTYTMTRQLYSGLGLADAFGFHLSNSSYAWAADHVRGPHIYTLLPTVLAIKGVFFALGSTAFKFIKEIGIGKTFEIKQELVAYEKKWLYFLTSFTTKSKKGEVILHATSLSHVVLKAGRRTIIPARAIAMSGFGQYGKVNALVVKRMSDKEKIKYLIGESEQAEIKVGEIEVGLEGRSEWPGSV